MKRRIFLGLAPIFVLIVAMGAYAVLLFTKLGTQVDVILRENFRSVLAGQQMKEAAERMDSGLFFSLVGEEERGRDLYTRNLPIFKEALKTELSNITVPGEDKLAEDLRRAHDEYAAPRRCVLANQGARTAARDVLRRNPAKFSHASRTPLRQSFPSIKMPWSRRTVTRGS